MPRARNPVENRSEGWRVSGQTGRRKPRASHLDLLRLGNNLSDMSFNISGNQLKLDRFSSDLCLVSTQSHRISLKM